MDKNIVRKYAGGKYKKIVQHKPEAEICIKLLIEKLDLKLDYEQEEKNLKHYVQSGTHIPPQGKERWNGRE